MRIKILNPLWCGRSTDPRETEYDCSGYEIIEEDKKIEKINLYIGRNNIEWDKVIVEKINELVDAVNELTNKLKEK